MNRRIALVTAAVLYAFAFGVLFGSHRGVFGDLVHGLDFTLKSKIINSLAVFGYVSIGFCIWILAVGKPASSRLGAVLFFALWLSFAYGFLSVDCAIFNFCGPSVEGDSGGCTSTHDKQGVHADCE